MLVLPSQRLLRLYKNSVQQKPGINNSQLQWMEKEAANAKLSDFGKRGGLLLDEMTIQDDLQVIWVIRPPHTMAGYTLINTFNIYILKLFPSFIEVKLVIRALTLI